MRPTIICHMSTSIDGCLHPSRFTRAANWDVLRGHYEKVHDRFEADGWIVGRRTASEMAKGTERNIADAPKLPREAHVGDIKGRKLAVTIDPSGRVHYGKDNIGGDHVVAVLGEQVSDTYLTELREDGVSYIFAGASGDDLSGAMQQLASHFHVDYAGPDGDRPGAGQSLRLTHCEMLEGGMVWLRHAVERGVE